VTNKDAKLVDENSRRVETSIQASSYVKRLGEVDLFVSFCTRAEPPSITAHQPEPSTCETEKPDSVPASSSATPSANGSRAAGTQASTAATSSSHGQVPAPADKGAAPVQRGSPAVVEALLEVGQQAEAQHQLRKAVALYGEVGTYLPAASAPAPIPPTTWPCIHVFLPVNDTQRLLPHSIACPRLCWHRRI
jgi:hypothetical protein